MSVRDVLLIICDKNSCLMFSNDCKNYGSSYTKDNINKASITLFVSPQENQLYEILLFWRQGLVIILFLKL